MGPVLIVGILYLQRTHLPQDLRPGVPAKLLLYFALILVTIVSGALLYFRF